MFCDIDGSIPGRKISFFPAAPDVVALSVAQFPGAAWSLTDEPEGLRLEKIPAQPIWLTMGSDWIDQADSYPAGLRAFVSALRGANRIRIALGASPSGLELTLDAECLSAESAAAIQQRLSAATTLLASMISRQGLRPNPNDLSGVLSAGTFETQGLAVKGRWPVTTAFLTNLTSGTL